MHVDIHIGCAWHAKRLIFGEDRNAGVTELLLDIRLELLRGEPDSFALRREVLNEDIHALQASQCRAREVAIVGTPPQGWQTDKTPQNGQSDEDTADASGRGCVCSHCSPLIGVDSYHVDLPISSARDHRGMSRMLTTHTSWRSPRHCIHIDRAIIS